MRLEGDGRRRPKEPTMDHAKGHAKKCPAARAVTPLERAMAVCACHVAKTAPELRTLALFATERCPRCDGGHAAGVCPGKPPAGKRAQLDLWG